MDSTFLDSGGGPAPAVVDASFHYLGLALAEESTDGSALILTVEGLQEMQTMLLAHAEKSLPSNVFGTGHLREEDAVLCSVAPLETGPYEGASCCNGKLQLDAVKFTGERMPLAAGPLVVSRAEEWGKLTEEQKKALRAQFNGISPGPVPVYVKRDSVVWRKAPAAEVVAGRKGALYVNFVLHPEMTLRAIRERRCAALMDVGLLSSPHHHLDHDIEAQNRPTEEQEEFQRAFGAVTLTRCATKIDYVGQNFKEDIQRASGPDAREQLVEHAQRILSNVQSSMADTILWRVEIVEDSLGCHLRESELLKDRYRILQKLGEGATARVFLCEDTNLPAESPSQNDSIDSVSMPASDPASVESDAVPLADVPVKYKARGRLRALKKMPMMAIRAGEAEAMRILDHPNIIKLFDSFYVGVTSYYMVLELSRGGALLNELEHLQNKKQYNERTCVGVMRQVLQAVHYIHSCGFLHRDIKPANFLVDRQLRDWVDAEDGEDAVGLVLTVKLADFGWVCRDSFVYSKHTLERAKRAIMATATASGGRGCSPAVEELVRTFLARAEEMLGDVEGKSSEITWSGFEFQKVFVQECLPNTSDKLSELSEHVKEAMEWCKVHAGDGDEDAFGQAGTTAFMAPEVVEGCERHSTPVDVWSCGVMLYTLLTSLLPFGRPDIPSALLERAILEGAVEREDPDGSAGPGSNLRYYQDDVNLAHCSEEVKCLLARMLTRAAGKRISAQEALEHAWIKNQAPHSAAKLKIPTDLAHRLRKFDDTCNLRKAAIYLLASHMDHAKMKDLASLFKELDADGSGIITLENIQQVEGIPVEVRTGLEKLLARRALTSASAASTAKTLPGQPDHNSSWASSTTSGSLDGLVASSSAALGINYTEFLAAVMDRQDLLTKNWSKTVFRLFDFDGDGKITAADVKKILLEQPSLRAILGDDVMMEETLAAADTNGDGVIDVHEFCAVMRADSHKNLIGEGSSRHLSSLDCRDLGVGARDCDDEGAKVSCRPWSYSIHGCFSFMRVRSRSKIVSSSDM